MRLRFLYLSIVLSCLFFQLNAQPGTIVFQSDFGTKDGAVSAMKGVASSVSGSLRLFDLTHEIPAYDIWEAAYRLEQTATYWPAGTVFVSVVDPGVGTNRRSVVLKTKSGHYIVTPDNGTLSFVAKSLGIESIREIDEAVNRRKGSEGSYTFHGRDVYAYTAARLAANQITFEQVGKLLSPEVVTIPYQQATLKGNVLHGNIPILDIQYGNVWTNIDASIFKQLNVKPGNLLIVSILHKGKQVYQQEMPFVETFGAVAEGKPLAYLNSLMNLSFAINMGNFSEKYKVKSGSEWRVVVKKSKIKSQKSKGKK